MWAALIGLSIEAIRDAAASAVQPVTDSLATVRLPVEIGDATLELEVLVGFPPQSGLTVGDLDDLAASATQGYSDVETSSHPVALVSHGTSRRAQAMTFRSMAPWVRSFAQRGYVAIAVKRRGFGRSDGDRFVAMGTCAEPDPVTYLDGQAADLLAVLEAISDWPRVDTSRVIAIGNSAGGASMFALAARLASAPSNHSDIRLRGIVNVAGGLFRREGDTDPRLRAYEGCEAYADALVQAMRTYGAAADTPSLWLYAPNDPYFVPELVRRMHVAWHGGETPYALEFLDEKLDDGHRIFVESAGIAQLWPRIDPFLSAFDMPTWDHRAFAELRDRLTERQRENLDRFLAERSAEKVFSVPLDDSGRSHWSYSYTTLDGARMEALARCRQESGSDCVVIAENFTPLCRPRDDRRPSSAAYATSANDPRPLCRAPQ